MEPRKTDYNTEDRQQLLALEQLVAQEFAILSQKIKSEGFTQSTPAVENSQSKVVFDKILEKAFLAYAKISPTTSDITAFTSIEDITLYFHDLLGEVNALNTISATPASSIYSWGKNDPKHVLFKEYIIACEKLTKILFFIKKLDTPVTNPKSVDLKLKTAQNQGEALYSRLPAAPEKELTSLNAEWEKQLQNRNKLETLPGDVRHQEEHLESPASNKICDIRKRINALEAALIQEEEKINENRGYLILRFNTLVGDVDTLVSEINNLIAIKEGRNKAVTSEMCNQRYSEDAILKLKKTYQDYCRELQSITNDLSNLRQEAGKAKQRKETAIQKIKNAIETEQYELQSAYDVLISNISNLNNDLINNHDAFFQKEQEVGRIIREPIVQLQAKMQDFPDEQTIDLCRTALKELDVLASAINESRTTLKQVCSSQDTSFSAYFLTTAEGKKWNAIGGQIESSLSKVSEALHTYHHQTSVNLSHLFPKKTSKIRENLETRLKDFKKIERKVDDKRKILNSLTEQITAVINKVKSNADRTLADLGNVVSNLEKQTNDILHFDFVNATVIEPTRIATLESNLSWLSTIDLSLTARKARELLAAEEKANDELDRDDRLYGVLLHAVESNLVEYEQKLNLFNQDSSLAAKLLNAKKYTEEAKKFYAQKNIHKAMEVIEIANEHISEAKEIARKLQQEKDRADIQANLILLRDCAHELKQYKNVSLHGFETDKQAIEECITSCETELKRQSSDYLELAQNVKDKLILARDIKKNVDRHLAEVEKSPNKEPIFASSTKSESLVVHDSVEKEKTSFSDNIVFNFLKRNWKPILIGFGIGIVITAGLVALALSGVVTFGAVPAAVGGLVALGISKGVAMGVVGAGASLLGGVVGSITCTAVTKFTKPVLNSIKNLFKPKNAVAPVEVSNEVKERDKSSQAKVLNEMRQFVDASSSKEAIEAVQPAPASEPVKTIITPLHPFPNGFYRHSARDSDGVRSVIQQQARRSQRGP